MGSQWKKGNPAKSLVINVYWTGDYMKQNFAIVEEKLRTGTHAPYKMCKKRLPDGGPIHFPSALAACVSNYQRANRVLQSGSDA